MRKKLSAFLISLTLVFGMGGIIFPAKAAPAAPKSLKILAIGNSFSTDATRHLHRAAKELGVEEVIIGNLYIGGCSIATHKTNAENNLSKYEYQKNENGTWVSTLNVSMLTGIKDEKWDFITLQQASGSSGEASTYSSDIDYLVNYINTNKTNSASKLGWHMTWAYQGNSTHGDFSKYGKNQLTMYNSIVSAVKTKIVTNSGFDFIIPAGTTIQNLRTSFVGDKLTRDGYHLSENLGRYTAALTWIATLTNLPYENITWVPDASEITSFHLDAVKEAVKNAKNTPYEVTNSTFTEYEEPKVNYNHYRILDWEPVETAYWNSTSTLFDELTSYENSSASNLPYFISSGRIFTKEDLPSGSFIEIDEGYQYRPEGWVEMKQQPASGRPAEVSAFRVFIDDAWWRDFNYRAFNVSAVGANTDLRRQLEEVSSKFRIYVPRDDLSSENRILSFKINGIEGNITENKISFTLPFGTDLSKPDLEIVVSEKATLFPSVNFAADFSSPVTYTVVAEDGSRREYTVEATVAAQTTVTAEKSGTGGCKASLFVFAVSLPLAGTLILAVRRRKDREGSPHSLL